MAPACMTTHPYEIAITASVFDLWHEGHQSLADFMDAQASLTIALIHDDLSTWQNKGRSPAQSLDHRMRIASACGGFLVYPVFERNPDTELDILIRRFLQGTRICFCRGDDAWPGGKFPGQEYLEKTGIPILLKPYLDGISSSERRKMNPA